MTVTWEDIRLVFWAVILAESNPVKTGAFDRHLLQSSGFSKGSLHRQYEEEECQQLLMWENWNILEEDPNQSFFLLFF